MLAVAEIVHYVCPYLYLPVKTKILSQSNVVGTRVSLKGEDSDASNDVRVCYITKKLGKNKHEQ
jgi:hypothetical protein